MYTFFYSDISEFAGNLQGMIDEVMYKTYIQNMHKIGWKANYFKCYDISMFVHGCGVSQYPQFYEKIENIYQLLPRPWIGNYSGEKGHKFLQKKWILALAKLVDKFVTVWISDMITIKYLHNLGKLWILQNRIFLKNEGLW